MYKQIEIKKKHSRHVFHPIENETYVFHLIENHNRETRTYCKPRTKNLKLDYNTSSPTNKESETYYKHT